MFDQKMMDEVTHDSLTGKSPQVEAKIIQLEHSDDKSQESNKPGFQFQIDEECEESSLK